MENTLIFSELVKALTEYSNLDRLLILKRQLEKDIFVIGKEELIMLQYKTVCEAIEKIKSTKGKEGYLKNANQ